jgi:co-chaperonin GroES (HSP10)
LAHAIAMVHDRDPGAEIMIECKPFLEGVRVLGTRILVGVYVPPEKTKSGIIITQNSRNDARYQGKVGLVLRMGPIAFEDDATHRFGDIKPKVGDWVVYNIGDTKGLELGQHRVRMVEDVHVDMIIENPDSVW